MDIFETIFENQYFTALLVGAVLILSEIMLWKKQMHYNHNTDDRMDNHILNRKYHLNEKKRIDLEYINKTISMWNIGGIIVACLIMCINLIAGVVAYTAITIVLNYYVSKRIATKYGMISK